MLRARASICQLGSGTLCLMLLWAINVFAAPGDILYIRGDVVNMRQGPSTKHRIVRQLPAGHKLVEIQRKGEWINVDTDGTGGHSGWVHASLVGPQLQVEATKAPGNAKFEAFKAAFNKAAARAEEKTGMKLFTKTEDLGGGIVQVTATDT